MQKVRGDVMSRLGGNPNKQRVQRIEFVNQAGKKVNPHNGKPYSRPVASSTTAKATNGVPKKRKKNNSVKSGAAVNNLPIKKFGVMFSGLNPIPTNPTVDPPPRVCYNCWQPGHQRKLCPRPVVAKICNNCGRRGEDLSTCPRCKVAHVRYLAALRGEKLDDHDIAQMFPQTDHQFVDERAYNESSALDDGIDETIQQLIDQEERERELNNYYDEQEREVEAAYQEPQVKYVETREYVKNPVSRHHEYHQEDQVTVRHREDYDYEDRADSYEERHEREKFPRYRERESSEDRSIERARRAGNTSVAELDSDPVQEVLQLAKSIAHLSPETQELIMKQVMGERREKARLRAMTMQDRVVDEDWP